MSERRHTTGPWTVESVATFEARSGLSRRELGITSGNAVISTVADKWLALCQVATHVEKLKDKEGLANAHLIAAAPELLEALKELLSACETDCGTPSDNDGDEEPVGGGLDHEGNPDPMALTFGHMRRAARAIAKAEGAAA